MGSARKRLRGAAEDSVRNDRTNFGHTGSAHSGNRAHGPESLGPVGIEAKTNWPRGEETLPAWPFSGVACGQVELPSTSDRSKRESTVLRLRATVQRPREADPKPLLCGTRIRRPSSGAKDAAQVAELHKIRGFEGHGSCRAPPGHNLAPAP